MDLSVAIFLIFNSIICKVLLCCKNVKWLELVPLCIVIFQNNICWNIFHDVFFFPSKASAAFNNFFFAVNLYFKFKPHMIELNNLGSLSVPDLIKVAYTCSLHGNIETQSLTFHTNIRVPHHSLNCLLRMFMFAKWLRFYCKNVLLNMPHALAHILSMLYRIRFLHQLNCFLG